MVDTEDAGEVLLSQRQPQVGYEIRATLSDPDGGVHLTRWVWERSDEAPSSACGSYALGWTPIDRALSPVYAPQPADVGRCLRVTAVYTDDLDDADQRATATLEAPVGEPRPAPTPDSDLASEAGLRQRRARVPRSGLLHRGRPVGQDEPDSGREHGGRAGDRRPGLRL